MNILVGYIIKMARLYALQKADMRALEKQAVRENPIRRGGYSGGAAPTKPAQFALASRRAGEIQANRQTTDSNGATPSMGVSRVRGGRAVPSSGLSQFRGGAMERMVGAGHGSDSDSDSDSDYEGCGRASEVLARESGRRPAIRSGLSDKHSAEAKEMGQHLGKHLIAVRGSGFFDLFQRGVAEAGQKADSMAEETDMPNPNDTPETVPTTTDIPVSGSGFFDQFKPHKKPDVSMKPIYVGGPAVLPTDMRARKPFLKKPVGKGKLTIIHGGYLSGAYEGMGSVDYSEQRRQGLAKRNAANAAAASRKTPAQKAAEAKQQAELKEQMEKQHKSTEEEKRANYSRRSSGMGKYYKGGMSGRMTPVGRHIPPRSPPRMRALQMCAQGENVTPPTDVTGSPARRIQPRPPAELQRGVSEGIERFKDEKAIEGLLKLKRGKARRAPAGPSDGRRARAEIVKKVMAEQGCSMIEASKYVKDHGLY